MALVKSGSVRFAWVGSILSNSSCKGAGLV